MCEALSSAQVPVRLRLEEVRRPIADGMLLLLGTELRQPLLLGTGVSPPPPSIPPGAGAPRVERVPRQLGFTPGESDLQPPIDGEVHMQPPIGIGARAKFIRVELTTPI